jgi:hypothetical protein
LSERARPEPRKLQVPATLTLAFLLHIQSLVEPQSRGGIISDFREARPWKWFSGSKPAQRVISQCYG